MEQTAAPSSYSSSPAGRLDSPHFAIALRVSHRWNAAAQLKTAWPQVVSLTRSLLEMTDREVCIGSEADAACMLRSMIYNKATSVTVGSRSLDAWAAGHLLGQLRQLAVLFWRPRKPIAYAIAQLSESSRQQIQALHLWHFESLSISPPDLVSFSQLRALTVHFCPPLEQLQQLVRLQHLHVGNNRCISPDLTRVIRYLSVHHYLTDVGLRSGGGGFADAAIANLTKEGDLLTETGVFAALPPNVNTNHQWWNGKYRHNAAVPLPPDAVCPLPPAALEEFSCTMHPLTLTQLEAVCAMPRLRKLECSIDESKFEKVSADRLRGLSQLHHLQLGVVEMSVPDPIEGWLGVLALCVNLRTLRLSINLEGKHEPEAQLDDESGYESDHELRSWPGLDLAVFLPSMPLLDDLTLDTRVDVDSWFVLSELQHLTRLSCRWTPAPDLALLAPIVASLPRFRSLSLHVGEESLLFPAGLMAHVASSHTWCSLHVCTTCANEPLWSIEWSDTKLGRLKPIDSEAARRFRVHHHAQHTVDENWAPPVVYRAGVRADGHRGWIEV